MQNRINYLLGGSVSKRMLLVKASNDVCSTEVSHIEKICDMFSISYEVIELTSLNQFMVAAQVLGKFVLIPRSACRPVQLRRV